MRCECDLQLARKLGEHEDDWNVEHHRRWGDNPFNAQESCRAHRAPTEPPTTTIPETTTPYPTAERPMISGAPVTVSGKI